MSLKIGSKKEAVLIDAVRQRRCLYDKTESDYREPTARQRAWEEIAADMEITVDDAKQIWCNLRNSFANVIRRRMKKPSHEFLKWKHEDNMLFVAPYMDNLTNKLLVFGDKVQFVGDEAESNEIPGDRDNSEYEENFINVDENSRNSDHNDARQDTVSERKSNRRQIKRTSVIPDLVSEFDGSELFYLSMAKVTKTLPKTEQAKLRVEISKIISEAEMQSDESGAE